MRCASSLPRRNWLVQVPTRVRKIKIASATCVVRETGTTAADGGVLARPHIRLLQRCEGTQAALYLRTDLASDTLMTMCVLSDPTVIPKSFCEIQRYKLGISLNDGYEANCG